jgi:hypothetical protein
MKLPGPRPLSVAELKLWLESYQEWNEALEAGGLYRVDPGGTSVRSNRAGRPTESVALYQADLSERCRIVDVWLQHLRPAERWMAEHYVTGGKMTARGIARQLGLRYGDVAATIRILPAMMYLDWYGEIDEV